MYHVNVYISRLTQTRAHALSTQNITDVSFDYMAYGATIGTMYLQGSADASTWTTVWSKGGNLGQSWFSASLTLNDYHYLRFYYVGGSSWNGDFALDDIMSVTVLPASHQ